MSAVVVRDPVTRKVDVWLGTPDQVLRLTADGWSYENTAWHERPAPSLSMDERVFEEMMREALKVLPFGDDAREALADTRMVRDRLLSLVERAWKQP